MFFNTANACPTGESPDPMPLSAWGAACAYGRLPTDLQRLIDGLCRARRKARLFRNVHIQIQDIHRTEMTPIETLLFRLRNSSINIPALGVVFVYDAMTSEDGNLLALHCWTEVTAFACPTPVTILTSDGAFDPGVEVVTHTI